MPVLLPTQEPKKKKKSGRFVRNSVCTSYWSKRRKIVCKMQLVVCVFVVIGTYADTHAKIRDQYGLVHFINKTLA